MAVISNPEKIAYPIKYWTLDVPARPEDIATRDHNRYAKEAGRRMMRRYFDKYVPRRFKREGRRLYSYRPRSERYKRIKARVYKVRRDMVKTGRSERQMTRQFKIRVGGQAGKGTLTPRLLLRFPFRGGGGRVQQRDNRKAINVLELVHEFRRFADDEPPELAEWFLEEYMRLVEQHRSTRKRIRIT